jgi:AbrB family transcriptional regulator (stage V sporulation protein T)
MKTTGIVRRIDDLGRLVIPKELRKTLRIKEGDPLEIYASEDVLMLKKYSPIITISSYAQIIADGIQTLTEKPCLITDGDAVIYASANKYKDVIGKTLSNEMEQILRDRKSVILNKSDGAKVITVAENSQIDAENQVIVPMILGGDCYGSIVLFDNDKASRFSSVDVKLLQLGACFLTAQFS